MNRYTYTHMQKILHIPTVPIWKKKENLIIQLREEQCLPFCIGTDKDLACSLYNEYGFNKRQETEIGRH